MTDHNRTWFHRSGTPGWLARSLLWLSQSAAVATVIYLLDGPLAASVVGTVAAAMLLFRQIDGMMRAAEP